ncbi:MAG: outer membrane protein OmpA [Verrucomicrobiaceae bacterium]|nr:outer membrane protein OmpA [Verrucomicrobiaceae bacterium]
MNSDYSRPSGGGPSPAIIVFGALIVSALVFFLFTRKHLTPKTQPTVVAVPAATVTSTPEVPVQPAPAPVAPKPVAPTPKPALAAALGFARPMDLATQVARSLASGDIAQVAKMVGGDDPTQEAAVTAVLDKILKGMGYKAGAEEKVQLLGQVGEATRLTVPLLKPGETAPLALQLDVERDVKMGWKITKFRLPKELEGALAAMPAMVGKTDPTTGQPVASAAGSAGKPASSLFIVEQHPDALAFASQFVEAMLHQDVAGARKFVDDAKVSAQKLAGMCIVFEEGDYALKASKPMVITVASPNESWVIAQVQSEKLQQATEFGMEMQRSAEDQPWKIVGLNLSDLLGSFAKNAGKMGVPYTPIVNNPHGGESLALYFEYDKASLHPRAQKQLSIVADLLKAKASRKLRITGRTDSLGTDGYNMQLSASRAKNVKEQLAALGVPADQVITEGMGKADPTGKTEKKADGTDDPEGRSRNRRAEIFLDF